MDGGSRAREAAASPWASFRASRATGWSARAQTSTSRWRCGWPGGRSSSRRVGLANAFPEAGPRLAVFLHGLMETEHSWERGRGTGAESYADRLRRELGYTPLQIRYNSGRRISENGASLAPLLEGADRVLAGGGRGPRPDRALDGRTGRPQRLPPGVWSGSWIGSGASATPSPSGRLTPARRSSRPSTTPAPRSVPCPRPGRSPASCAAEAAASATFEEARWWTRTGSTATPTAGASAARSRHTAHLASSRPPSRAARPSGRPVVGDLLVLEPSASDRSRRLAFRRGARPPTSAGPTTSPCCRRSSLCYERLRGRLRTAQRPPAQADLRGDRARPPSCSSPAPARRWPR